MRHLFVPTELALCWALGEKVRRLVHCVFYTQELCQEEEDRDGDEEESHEPVFGMESSPTVFWLCMG